MDFENEPILPASAARRKGKAKGRINNYPFCRWLTNLTIPFFTFSLCFSLVGSRERYLQPYVTMIAVTLSIIVVLCGAWMLAFLFSARDEKARKAGIPRDPNRTWWNFGGATLLTAAAVIGLMAGNTNYTNSMLPYYVLEYSQAQPSIDPRRDAGGSMLDAGQLFFVEGSGVDTDKSMAYTHWDKFCVAPISAREPNSAGNEAPPGTTPLMDLQRYDYWAIGVNCCQTQNPDFSKCGQAANKRARQGIRLMYPEQTAFFRKAVEQAEARYNLVAGPNPVFLYWVEDIALEKSKFRYAGFEETVMGCAMWLSMGLFLACLFT